MKLAADSLFISNPTPMWVYDLETLRFLAVNNAAIANYGYSREEFLAMTIAEIRPPEDRDALARNVAEVTEGPSNAGVWRHCLKNGQMIHVDVASHTIIYDGRRGELIAARDVSRLVAAERSALHALAREREARYSSDALARQFQVMFDSVPGMFLVFSQENLDVVAVSDAFLAVLGATRSDIVGRNVFDALPEQPQDLARDNLRSSFDRVRASGDADLLEVQLFRLPKADGSQQIEDRHWAMSCTPIKGPDGRLMQLMLRMRDVTGFISEFGVPSDTDRDSLLERAKLELIAHTHELKTDNLRLAEMATKLRTTERLLNTGTWDYVFEEDRLYWSRNVYGIYGIDKGSFGGSFEDYVALVHPDNRSAMRSNFAEFMASGESSFHFSHKVCHADGRVVHVQGLAERTETATGPALSGVVQDVTQSVEASYELAQAKRLLDIAGTSARFGAWRYDVLTDRLEWSPQTARIHDEPEGFSPSVADGIAYYVPEHRDRITALFQSCLASGERFSDSLQIISSKGRRVWVRATGQPERDEANQIVAVHGSFQDISELVIARQKTEELSNRLAETLEHISDAFMLLDKQLNFLFVNEKAAAFINIKPEDLIGKHYSEIYPENHISPFRAHYERAIAEQRVIRFTEFSSILGKWLSVDAHPTPDGLAAYIRDVTDQKSQDKQLRLLETAASRLNDIILITEADTIDGPEGPKIVYVNDAFERRTGYSREEAIGQTPRILQGPKTQRVELDRIRQALENWQPVRSELINYTKSGDEFWLELEIVPVADEKGWFTHWVAVERDITARKQADLALQASEERFRLITMAAGSAIWDWDAATDHHWWSEGLRKIFGHEPDQFGTLQASWLNYVHPDDLARVDVALKRVRSGQDNSMRLQYRFRRVDDSWAVVEDNAFAMRDDAGNVCRVLGSLTDISEQKLLEDRLRQSQKMEAVGQLTGGVAHDFNNLLTIIMGNAEILEEELSDRPHLQALASMSLGAADRGADLTNRLLAFSRKQALKPEVLDVAQLIQGMDGLLRRTLPENISIEIVRSGGLWKIEADASQLESALLNLAVNARDAMPEGGSLTIEMANAMLDDDYVAAEPEVRPGQYMVIIVTDTGTGMPPHVVNRVFEPFFTTKDVGKGSGLGLSMVFGFVKQSQGHVRVYSEVGEGTAIKLYFPRTRTTQNAVPVVSSRQKIEGGTETILVVEDDASVREYVTAQLRSLGYNVLQASSSAEAMTILEQASPIDLLFTDVVMPGGMGGKALAEAASKLRPLLKILYTSGYTENSIVHHGRLDPGVKLLNKPYRRENLAAKVREVLDEQGSKASGSE